MNENKFSEILQELSECREDERNSQSQMLQTIAAVASALTLILGASTFDKNGILFQSLKIRLIIYILCVVILLCGVSYIAYLGIGNVLRFHYIKHLEDSLSSMSNKESTFIHWMSFNSAINTKNIKHIFTSRYTFISYFSYFISTTFAILFCLGLLTAQYIAFEFNMHILIITPFVLIFIAFLIFIWISIKAKDMYNFSYYYSVKRQKLRLFKNNLNFINMDKEKSMIKFYIKELIYFIYPKTKDFQKIIFVLGGYILGIILTCEPINFFNALHMHINKILLVLIIIDILIYQARYQFNDIRGLKEDIEIMKLMKKTSKFLPLCQNKTQSVVLSFLFMFIKIILALFLTFKFGDSMKTPLLWCIFLIFLTTILYEAARTQKCDIAIFVLVTCGYPLRFLTGIWCVIPNLFTVGIQFNGLTIKPFQIVLYLISIAALGGFSATIPWVYEAFYQKKSGDRIVKHHYEYLFKSFEERHNQYNSNNNKKTFYPLLEKGKLRDCWNLYFLLSTILLSINIIMFNSYGDYFILFIALESLTVLLSIILCYSSYKKITLILIISIITIIAKIFLSVLFCNPFINYISIGLYTHQILFMSLYCWLRCRFDPSFNFFKQLFSLLIGSDTLKLIEKEN